MNYLMVFEPMQHFSIHGSSYKQFFNATAGNNTKAYVPSWRSASFVSPAASHTLPLRGESLRSVKRYSKSIQELCKKQFSPKHYVQDERKNIAYIMTVEHDTVVKDTQGRINGHFRVTTPIAGKLSL